MPPTGQTNRSNQSVKPTGQTNRSNQPVKPTGQTNRSNQPVKPTGQNTQLTWNQNAKLMFLAKHWFDVEVPPSADLGWRAGAPQALFRMDNISERRAVVEDWHGPAATPLPGGGGGGGHEAKGTLLPIDPPGHRPYGHRSNRC